MHGHRRALTRCLLTIALCSLGASAAEAAKCTVSATSIVFGTYNVFAAAPTDSTATVVYNCNGGAKNVWITITAGTSGTFSTRQMANGTERLGYNLFLNPPRTTIWGDLTGGSSVHTDPNPPNNEDLTATIYGRIPAGQDISAGAYSDVVSIEINF
jgi:spore coat protein U-like protein